MNQEQTITQADFDNLRALEEADELTSHIEEVWPVLQVVAARAGQATPPGHYFKRYGKWIGDSALVNSRARLIEAIRVFTSRCSASACLCQELRGAARLYFGSSEFGH
jgi:hypothetical protein